VLVADAAQLAPGTSGTFSSLTAFGDTLAFALGDYGENTLWATDGTPVGTRQILPSGGRLNATINTLANLGGSLYFAGDDGFTGFELWTTDGTSAGTARIADAVPGSQGSSPKHFVELAGRAVFFANMDQLWTSDGTIGGTNLVADLNRTPLTNVQIKVFNGFAYFVATTSSQRELWRTDGTTSGTTMLMSVSGGPYWGSPSLGNLTVVGDTLYFSAYLSDQNSLSLWKIEMSQGSAVQVSAPGIPQRLSNFVARGDTLFFVGQDTQAGAELWRSDGSQAGTQRVANIQPNGDAFAPDSPYHFGDWPYQVTVAGDEVYFPANDGVSGVELWRSDGTEAGTQRVKDIVPGAGDSHPTGLVAVEGVLYFRTRAGTTWRSDGTEAGTAQVDGVVIGPGIDDGHGGVYSVQHTAATGYAIWHSDGTAAGTTLFADVNPGPDSWTAYNLRLIGDALYFIAHDGAIGYGLWRSDGTEAGTLLLHDIGNGSHQDQIAFAALGETFIGNGYDGSGFELWTLRPEDSAPAGGDFDNDARIDGNDFLAWQRQLGSMTLDADASQNRIVDAADLAYWKNGVGWAAEDMESALAAVPVADASERDAAFDVIAAADMAGWSACGAIARHVELALEKRLQVRDSAYAGARAQDTPARCDNNRANVSTPKRPPVIHGGTIEKGPDGLNANLADHKLGMTRLWDVWPNVS
jgi:ELWxxDGT repeat protein